MKTHLSLLFSVSLAASAFGDEGLIGNYYSGYSVVSNTIVFDGLTLMSTQTNTVFDHWNGSQYYDWNPAEGVLPCPPRVSLLASFDQQQPVTRRRSRKLAGMAAYYGHCRTPGAGARIDPGNDGRRRERVEL